MLLLAACGDDDGGDDAETDETEESSGSEESEETTTTTLSEEDEVLAAYEAANDALTAAWNPPDPEHPDLAATMDGEMLDRMHSLLLQGQSGGFSYETTVEINASTPMVSGDSATIDDCFVDRTKTIDTETGEPIGEPAETEQGRRAEMERIDGTWKWVRSEEVEGICG